MKAFVRSKRATGGLFTIWGGFFILNIKKVIYTSLLTALGILLPIAFHSIPNAGGIFLPMHIPVLLCGLICGFPYGLICGIITPLLSTLMTGMPPAAILPGMLCELAVYGTVSSLLISFIRFKNTYVNIYISLIVAMLAGRIVSGLLNAFIFMAGKYSMQIWIASSFLTALPGIVFQLLLIPAIIVVLRRARVIEITFKH